MNLFFRFCFVVLICLGLLEALYFSEQRKASSNKSLITTAYTKPGYKYWSKENGAKICALDTLDTKTFETNLNKYSKQKTNVIYFYNTDIQKCKKHIPEIAKLIHNRNWEFAINLENNFDYKSAFNKDFKGINGQYYLDKFQDFPDFDKWIDYVVVDNAMEFMTYENRKELVITLRKIFPKSFVGFRFTKHYLTDPGQSHPNRKDKKVQEFLPQDNDGDFVILTYKPYDIKRSRVFIEDKSVDRIGFDGEFL